MWGPLEYNDEVRANLTVEVNLVEGTEESESEPSTVSGSCNHVYWYESPPVKFLSDFLLKGSFLQVKNIHVARTLHQIEITEEQNLSFKEEEQEIAYSAIIEACKRGYAEMKFIYLDEYGSIQTLLICRESSMTDLLKSNPKILLWDYGSRKCRVEVRITEEGSEWLTDMWNKYSNDLRLLYSTVYRPHKRVYLKPPKGYSKKFKCDNVYTLEPDKQIGDGHLQINLTEVHY